MQALQLDFFPEPETIPTSKEVKEIKEIAILTKGSADRVRKSLFARHNELARKYSELNQRLDIIERNICTNEQ